MADEQEPGIIPEIQAPKIVIDDAFLEKRPLSYSSLKAFRKSPKHYIKYVTEPKVPSDAQLLGSIIDCLVLTPDLFNQRFQIMNVKLNLRTNDGKAEMARLQANAMLNKLTLITQEDYIIATKAKESIMYTPDARAFVDGMTKTQVKLSWRNKKLKLPFVGYVDFESRVWGEHFAGDLKSGKTADPEEIAREVLKWEYHLQTGTYLDGYHKIRFQFPYFVFLFVETAEPFNCSVNFCDNKFVEKAKEEFYGTIRAFRYCMDHDLFHQGYEFRLLNTKSYFSLHLPGYYRPKFSGFDEESEK